MIPYLVLYLVRPPSRRLRFGRVVPDSVEFLNPGRKREGKGFMTIKIDLEKAYDHLSWKFIEKTLEGLGFPGVWVRNIMHCITTSRMSVLCNGKKLEYF